MAGTAIEGGRVATEGATLGGVAAEAPIARVGIIELLSIVKFLRLLKMHPVEGRKKTRTRAANWSRYRNPKIVGWQVHD